MCAKQALARRFSSKTRRANKQLARSSVSAPSTASVVMSRP
jgi:hypothetical protein